LLDKKTDIEFLLRGSVMPEKITINETPVDFDIYMIENSHYVTFSTKGISFKDVQISLR